MSLKLDKETLGVIIFCVVILLVWQPVGRMLGVVPPAGERDVNLSALAAQKELPAGVRTLANRNLELVVNPELGRIERVTLPGYKDRTREFPIVLDQALANVGGLAVFDRSAPWTLLGVEENRLDEEAKSLTVKRKFRAIGGEEFFLTQEWRLADDYEVANTVTFENLSGKPLAFPALVVNGGDLAPWEMYSGDKVRTPSHRMDALTVTGSYIDVKADKKDADFFLTPAPLVKWASAGNKYFTTMLTADQPFVLHQNRFSYVGVLEKTPKMIIEVGASYPNFYLEGKAVKTLGFKAYYGPKIIAEVRAFDSTADKIMHLAWGPFDYLSRFLLWMLVELNKLVGSYGISIIFLTLIVRALFYPITAKSNASMRKMQALKPQLDELKVKYKDNPQMFSSKMWELYGREKVNPFSGCFPLLLQLPVFLALYSTLDGAVELRQVPFLWAKDLAAADTIWTLSVFDYNLALNPFVLLMTFFMVILQHMTPMSMEPMQKKMMTAMPIVMLIVLYDLPSGLTLYWTVSNIFSIVQLYVQKRGNLKIQGTGPAKSAGN